MSDNSSISVSEALNHIQSWLNAKEYDKVIQGCSEILELEPGNQRALALIKHAEEARHRSQQTTPQAKPDPETPLKEVEDPLAKLQVENAPSRFENSPSRREVPAGEKRQFFLAMLIPAVLVVLIGGGIIWYLADQQRSDLLADTGTSSVIEAPDDTSYLKENDQRIDDMTKIAQILELYKAEHGSYPALNQVDVALVQSALFEKVPTDARQGEIDKAGKEFGYVYAVYSNFGKANQAYVLSALFEDSKGFGYTWTSGAPAKNYPNYRTVDEVNATFIGDQQ